MVLRESAHAHAPGARHLPLRRLEISEDHFEQRALADSIGADERDARFHIEAEVDFGEERRLVRVVEADVDELRRATHANVRR